MNIYQAAAILTRERHNGKAWLVIHVSDREAACYLKGYDDDDCVFVNGFSAVALAREYERRSPHPNAESMTAADWFEMLVEANEIGDANAASVALSNLRDAGWEIKGTDGSWGDRESNA